MKYHGTGFSIGLMFELDKPVKILQLIGAALAIPVGIAGTFGVLRNFGSGGVSCSDLERSISATLERNITVEAKRVLARGDIVQFNKYCAADNPESRLAFEAALAPATPSRMGPRVGAGAQEHAPAAIFGLSRDGERRGWVALIRHDTQHRQEITFEGYPISATSLPPAGTVLKARRMLPVWLEPQVLKNDPSALQGRLAAGSCVKVLATRPGRFRSWAEVTPEACKEDAPPPAG